MLDPEIVEELEARLDIDYTASILQPLQHPGLDKYDIRLQVKRDDLLHPIIAGNKWRKLKYSLVDAIAMGHDHIISMGGAWSNHLHALAFIGHKLGIKTTGLIRGEEELADTPTLQDLEQWGMQLQFVKRTDYRQLRTYRQHDDPPAQKLSGYWLPEGGASALALAGVAELELEMDSHIDNLFVACGTGTTLAGLLTGSGEYRLTGIPVLRAETFMQAEINRLVGDTVARKDWALHFDYHFGGFARKNDDLMSFIAEFETISDIPIEPVYTGKLFYAIFNLVETGKIKPGSRIVALHSGGLQGKRPSR